MLISWEEHIIHHVTPHDNSNVMTNKLTVSLPRIIHQMTSNINAARICKDMSIISFITEVFFQTFYSVVAAWRQAPFVFLV